MTHPQFPRSQDEERVLLTHSLNVSPVQTLSSRNSTTSDSVHLRFRFSVPRSIPWCIWWKSCIDWLSCYYWPKKSRVGLSFVVLIHSVADNVFTTSVTRKNINGMRNEISRRTVFMQFSGTKLKIFKNLPRRRQQCTRDKRNPPAYQRNPCRLHRGTDVNKWTIVERFSSFGQILLPWRPWTFRL